MSRRSIRVALLLCDTPLPAVVAESGTYLNIFTRWLESALESYPDSDIAQNTQVVVDGYDVVDKHEYPPESTLRAGSPNSYDVVMLTGSKHTAHDLANPFIPPLIEFVRHVGTSPDTHHVKLVGICFGHQIISIAMGGECVRGDNGWEIGVYGNELTREGRYWWTGDVEGQGGEEKIFVEQMHRDHVPSLPPGFTLLGRTPRYAVHSMVKLHPSSTPTRPVAQILTIQGHPEFTPSVVSHIVDARSAMGIFDDAATKEARRRLGGKDGSGGEGYGRVGWAVWRMMLGK